MKMKLKENKGITLIALIITIIVLLILAVVTISAVNEGNIFAHANNAATRYNAAATEENSLLTNYLGEMALHDGETQNPQGGDNPQDQQTPADSSEIVGTYYAASGEEDYTIKIDAITLNFLGQNASYEYSNNVISANIFDTDITWNYEELENGTKTLCIENKIGAPLLYTTDVSKLTTGTITGKYSNTNEDYLNFIDSTQVNTLTHGGEAESTHTYKYLPQYNLLYIAHDELSDWYEVGENTVKYYSDNGNEVIYTKQN